MKNIKNCLHCGKEFLPRFGREKCCSKSCAALVREARLRAQQEKQVHSDNLNAAKYLRGAY